MPWPGIFTGIIWLGFYVWISNHVIVQRVLAAKNLDHGRWGALFAAGMQLPLLVFPGILARGVFADLEDPDLAWPSLVVDDFVETRRKKELSDKASLRLSRVLVFVFMLIAIAGPR